MSPSETSFHVGIVGGGVAGLATGIGVLDGAARRGLDVRVTVFEADADIGGHLRTVVEAGWQLEWGPNGFLDSEPATLRLVDRLGLRDHLLRSADAARRRFLFKEEQLHELPTSPGAFLRTGLLSWRGKLRVAGEVVVPARRVASAAEDNHRDETVHEFGVRRLGVEFAETFLDPMVKGIFGGDSRRLSLAAAFPRMVELESEYGGLFRAMASLSRRRRRRTDVGPGGVLHSFVGGMAELATALADNLRSQENTEIRTRRPVDKLHHENARWWIDGDGPYDAVVVATPAHAAASAVPDSVLANELSAIDYVPMAVVTLGFRREDVGHELDGFGHLYPTSEGRRLLGALWTSSIFPGRAPDGAVLLRCMAGGPRDRGVLELEDDELVEAAMRDLRDLLCLRREPTRRWVFRHPRAIAQYEPGHLARLRRIDDRLRSLPGLALTGSSYRGVSVNHCAKEAEATALRVLEGLVPKEGGP